MRGGARRNKPAATRALHGSKPRSHHKPEPQFGELSAAAPASLNAAECVYWTYYVAILTAGKVLTAADRDTLKGYCVALAQIDDIKGQQRAPEYRRVMVVGPVKVDTHPLDAQLRQWLQIARLCASDLGLTPASRGRVALTGGEGDEGQNRVAQLQAQARRLRAVK